MSEFTKLLNILKARYKTFGLVYGNDFFIPQVAVIENFKILAAFKVVNSLNRKKMIGLDESMLTFKAMNGLMTNPQLDLKMLSYWNDMESSNETSANSSQIAGIRKKIVALCRYKDQNGNNFYKTIRKNIFDDLVKNSTDHREAFNGLERIYSFLPMELTQRNLSHFHFYEVKFSQVSKSIFPSFQIFKCNFELADLSMKTQENEIKARKANAPFFYESRAGNINEKIRLFTISVAREISCNLKAHVKEMQVSIVFDPNEFLWLLNAENIQIVNQQGIDLPFLKAEKFVSQLDRDFSKRVRCAGLYCENKEAFNHTLIDEKDDSNNFYVMRSGGSGALHMIPFRSIVLDFMERLQTVKRIQAACPDLSPGFVGNLTEGVLLKFRKFYSLADISKLKGVNFKKISNLYEKKTICTICKHVYDRVDKLRIKAEGKAVDFFDKQIEKEIVRFFQEYQGTYHHPLNEKNIFSENYIGLLKEFESESELVEENKNLNKEKEKALFPSLAVSTKKERKPSSFWNVQRKRKTVNSRDSELLGLKHYLGNFQDPNIVRNGLVISQSSIAINKLNNKVNRLEKLSKRYNMLYEEDVMGTFSKTHQADSGPLPDPYQRERMASTGKGFGAYQANPPVEEGGSFKSPTSKLGSDVSFAGSYPSNRNDLKIKMRFNNDREAQKKEREAQQQKFINENYELRESVKSAFASERSNRLAFGKRRPFEEIDSSDNSSAD